MVILLLHDSSDVVGDLVKMFNYMGLDEKSGLYLTEVMFVINLGTWAWLRLWLFPRKCVYSAVFEFPLGDQGAAPAGRVCGVLLCVLQAMHVWWYYLFLRITYRLLSAENAHDAGREEYEGSSDSEPPTDDDDANATQKRSSPVRKRTTRKMSED